MNDYDRQPEGYENNTDDLPPTSVEDPAQQAYSADIPRSLAPTSVFCIQCGYNLTGVAIGSTCPECGRTVTPSFHSQTLPTSGKAIASMVLGICSIVGCIFYGIPSLVCAPLAIIFAILAKKQVQRGEAGSASTGMATAGLVCGIVGLTLVLLFICFIVVIIITESF